MDAGSEVDALIAEKLFGCIWWHHERGHSLLLEADSVEWVPKVNAGTKLIRGRAPNETTADFGIDRHYSTDLADAFRVVTRMEARGYWCEVRTPFMEPHGNDGYWAGFTPHGTSGWNGTPDHWTQTAALPLSICLAALACLAAEAERQAMPDDE